MKSVKKKYTLRTIEELLWKLITAPEGVEKALQEIPISTLPILGDCRLTGAQRLDIYANMYFFRIRDSLKEDFPSILKKIGEARFHSLVTGYLVKYPPTHWSLRFAGENMALFLKTHALTRQSPYLHDLARLEWALLTAFDAGDATPLTRDVLSTLDLTRWSGIRMGVVPSFQLVRFDWPVDEIRERLLRGRNVDSIKKDHRILAIWRQALKVYFRSVDPDEAILMKQLISGTKLGNLGERIGKEKGEQAAPLLAKFLQGWIEEGIIPLPKIQPKGSRLGHPDP